MGGGLFLGPWPLTGEKAIPVTMDDQKLSLNWSNFQDNLISTFGDLRHDTDFVDVTLACEDQSLKAHQVALSACSPFFKKMLKIFSYLEQLCRRVE